MLFFYPWALYRGGPKEQERDTMRLRKRLGGEKQLVSLVFHGKTVTLARYQRQQDARFLFAAAPNCHYGVFLV